MAALDELWRRRLIKEQGAAYDFDHDKLRKVAYGMISPARRRRLHRTVAQALHQVHAERPGPVMARLAAHYEQAGQLREAAAAYRGAGEHALHVLATDDAVAALRRALALTEQLPRGRDRDELELEIRMVEAVTIVMRSGYGAPAVEWTYERVLSLARHLGLPPPPPALRGLGLAAMIACRLQRARELGEELLASDGGLAASIEGHYVVGVATHWMGNFNAARHHLATAVDRYRPDLGPVHLTRFAQDPEAVCRSRLAWTLWCLGQPDTAVAMLSEARAVARRVGQPLTSAYVGWVEALLALEARDADRLRETFDKNLAHWTVNPVFSEIFPPLFGGWIRLLDGDPRGLATLREAVQATNRETHALFHTYALVLLARGLLAQRQVAEATDPLADALTWTEERNQRYLEAEIHRLGGEVAVALDDAPTAEQRFERAFETAVSQQARAYQLRAACSLAHHRRDAETVARLQSVYEAFGEGHDTADLRSAACLLAGAGS